MTAPTPSPEQRATRQRWAESTPLDVYSVPCPACGAPPRVICPRAVIHHERRLAAEVGS